MIFKTSREGFKFMNMNDNKTYVGIRFRESVPNLATLNATSMLWIKVNTSTPGAGFIVFTNKLNPNQQSWLAFTTSSLKFFMNNPQLGTTTYAPIFAQTPTETSPGNQVATKEYVDNNFVKRPPLYTGGIFSKYQTTEVWTDHFIEVNPFIRTYYARIEFLGKGPGGEDGKNCALGSLYFDCVSYITLLTPFEANTLFSLYPYKSILFQVTLRGRTGAFVVDFCKNFSINGAPDDKLYWQVRENYDAGGWAPESNYARRVFAVDRASGPGTAFIQVYGPEANIIDCPKYKYSAY
jgi:hypothetical protein